MTMKNLLNILLISACLLHSSFAADAPSPEPTAQVVFICDHGSAKSMIAASHFNQRASQRGLPYRAISRGITPDAALQPATQQGLSQDGIRTEGLTPRTVTPEVTDAASRVVTITVESTPSFIQSDKLEAWNDIPAVSKDYGASRDAMVRKIDALIANLEAANK
jgi:protein-tyrosine-phosphatase